MEEDVASFPGAEDFIQHENRSAQATTMASLDDDPEKAARAQELSKATGVHPAIVYGNLENFEQQHKAALTSQLINNNQFLREYVNLHPLAPKISNDDFGQLDAVSESTLKLGSKAILHSAIEGAKAGFGEGPMGQWLGEDFAHKYPAAWVAWSVLGMPIEIPARSFNAALFGGAAAMGESAKQLGLSDAWADRFTRDLIQLGMVSLGPKGEPTVPKEFQALAKQAQEIHAVAEPYIKAGLEPPVGLHPEIDKIKTEQAKLDAKNLDDALAESTASATRERSPELFSNFIRQHTEAKIGISADAVRKLYGEKEPATEDGILGWIPNIGDQLRAAEAIGGDVEVPLADWLGKVDKEVAKELKDDIRVRPGGVTLNEAKGFRAQASQEEEPDHMIGYHGTGKPPFKEFDPGAAGARATKGPGWEEASFFSRDPESAAGWAGDVFGENQPRVVKAKIDLRNAETFDLRKLWEDPEIREEAIRGNTPPYYKEHPEKYEEYRQRALEHFEEVDRRRKYDEEEVPKIMREGGKEAGLPPEEVEATIANRKPWKVPYGMGLVDAVIKRARAKGRDVAIIENISEGGQQIAVLNPKAIKPFYTTGEAIESLRQSAGLEPMFSLEPLFAREGIKELKLKRVAGTEHEFKIQNEVGENAGDLHIIEEDGGRSLRIQWIGGVGVSEKGDVSNVLGPRAIRSLLGELRREFPEAETIYGQRVSGAREVAKEERIRKLEEAGKEVTDEELTFETVSIPLKARADISEDQIHADFAKILGWGSVGTSPERGESIIPASAKPSTDKLYADHGMLSFGSKTSFPASEALKGVDVDSLTGISVVLGRFFKGKLDKLAGDTVIHILPDKEHARLAGMLEANKKATGGKAQVMGMYLTRKTGEHFITLPESVANGSYGPGMATHKVIHELTHAATTRAMRESLELRNHVRGMMDETREFLEEADPKALTTHQYAFTNEYEFVAEAFSKPGLQEVLSVTPLSEALAKQMGLGKGKQTVWDAVRKIVHDVLDKLLGIKVGDTILDGILQFGKLIEEGKYEKDQPKAAKSLASQGELPGMTRMEDRDLFEKAAAIGMTKDQYQRYIKLIDKRNQEDLEAQAKAAYRDAQQRETKEWKENQGRVRGEVEESLATRPDIQADDMFRTGVLYGDKLPKRPKLDSASLTAEQRNALPKDYVAKDGINPDDAAGLFGFTSGSAMVDRLVELNAQRAQTGLQPKEFFKGLVDQETDRQMQARYGDLGENILAEAKEHILSTTQMDMIHEEVLALGVKAGGELPMSKTDLRRWVSDTISGMVISSIDSSKFLAFAGKAGAGAELVQRSGKEVSPLDAFKAKQLQEKALLMAKEAVKIEKERDQFDRLAKRFNSREITSVLPEYTNFIHDILLKVGQPVRRSIQDLQEAIAASGYKDLLSFVTSKKNESFGMREIPIADFLFDPSFRKKLDDLTVDEFREVRDSVKTLAKQGADEKKIITAGATADREVVLDEMKEKIRTFPEKEYKATEGKVSKALDIPKTYLASGINTETLLNRWDRNDPRGVFNTYLVRPLTEAANYKPKLDRKYAKEYQAVGLEDVKDRKKLLQSPLIDPLSGREFTGFTKNNALAILQNMGNKGNWEVLTKGYDIDPETLRQWVFNNLTKEDFDRAQSMGDMFGRIFEEAETVYRNITGVAPERIELEPIDTPFGTYKGWYHPLIKDPIREGKSKKQRGGGVYDENDSPHVSVANGYTKRRTGATYPLDLNFDMVPVRMSQMLHDIAFRQAIIESEKIFNDTSFRATLTKHYGIHYKDGLMPFLEGVAGAESVPSKAAALATRVSEYLRSNTISAYIGFNIYTALKHGPTAWVMSMNEVGPVNFLNAVKSAFGKSEEIGLSNREFAMKHSEELQRRQRHWQDTIAGQHKEIYGEPTMRERVIEMGSKMVSTSDMMSALPTWLAQYGNSIRDEVDHGQAVFEADRAVRRAHGSTAVTNQPALVRGGGPLHGWLTTVYGFFGTVMQRRVEIAQQINDTYKLGREGELKSAAANVPAIAASIFTYVIWPTVVEEWVTGLTTDDKRGLGTHILTAAMSGMASSMVYIRDIIHGMVTGQEPGVGMISSPLHDVTKLTRDLKQGKKMFSKEHAGNLVGDTITVFGEATGLAPKEVGNVAKFGINVARGQEKPKTFTDWRMGLTRGTSKKVQVK